MKTFEIECPIDVAPGLFGGGSVSTGTTKDVPGGVVIQLGGMPLQKRSAGGASPFLMLVVSCGKDVAVGIFSAWLYDKAKKSKLKTMTINRRTVEISSDGIARAIEETIEIEDGS